MFDFVLGILQGSVSAIISGAVLLWIIFPRMAPATAKHTIRAAKDDKDIANLIEKGRGILSNLEPYSNLAKKVSPEDIERFLKKLDKIFG